MEQGRVVRVQKIPPREFKPAEAEELLCTLCYFYPQYTYAVAKKLPYKRLQRLIKVARKEEAKKYYELTQIVAAPHTEKGDGVRSLLERYKEEFQNGR